MEHLDPRVDTYISQAAPFAQPILQHLRKLVHQAIPETAETMKWSFPHFDYKGMMCSMAAFKQHCTFGFWKASLLADPQGLLSRGEKTAMGQLGQIKSLADLPADDVLMGFIREAARLNLEEVKAPAKPKVASPKELVIPQYFMEALGSNADALRTFEEFPYSHKKEYVAWVTEAKSEVTRTNRLATTVEWLAEGKSRNWKYERK